MVEIRPADSSRLAHVAEVIGRAFVTEPMMTWGLRGPTETLEERCIRFHELFLEPLVDRGIVWESSDGHGALVLVPPEEAGALDNALAIDDSKTHQVTDDGGRRYELFWEWVGSQRPREPVWHLDSVAVRPGWQGRGIGSALVEFGLSMRVRAVPPWCSRPVRSATSRFTSASNSTSSRKRTRPRADLTSGSCVATRS